MSTSTPTFGATARARIPTRPAPSAAASDFVLDPGLLRDVGRRSAAELLTMAPGVLLANHSGEGHAMAVFLRGFDAGEGQNLEFRVGGMPLNDPSNAHGHGYADTNFVIPELVSGLRVIEGPFDPSQGDFAVAGTVEYQLGLDVRGLRVRTEYGSFDTKRLVATWGPEQAGTGTFVGMDLRNTTGFGVNRGATSATLMAGLDGRFDAHTRWSLVALSHLAEFQSAGVVRADDVQLGRLSACGASFDAQFFCTPDPNQGGATQRHGAILRVDWRDRNATFTSVLFASARHLHIREDFTGYLRDARGDGLDETYTTAVVGARGAYRVRAPWLGFEQSLEVGYVTRFDAGDTRMLRARRADGIPYETVFDDGLRIGNVGAYASGDLRFTEWLAVRGGLRADAFFYGIEARNEPTTDRSGTRLSTRAFDAAGLAFEPRASVDLTLAPWLHWVTSFGRGARSSDGPALSQGERAPFAEVTALESGFTSELSAGPEGAHDWTLDARAIAFTTQVDRDLVFDPDRGRNVVVGRSSRFGALGFARLRFAQRVDLLASVTWTEAFQPTPEAAWWDLAGGPRLPYVPRVVARVEGAWRETVAIDTQRFLVSASLGVTVLGPRPLPLSTESEPYAVVDAAVRVRWELVEVGVLARNLFDARYRSFELNYASNFASPDAAPSLRAERTFAAGAPLTVLGTLTLFLETGPSSGDEHAP